MDWFEAITLGIIQGITEFLPISSDGHLAVATQAFAARRGTRVDGSAALFFNVMLHLGTLTAIVLHYRRGAVDGAKGLLGETAVPPAFRRASVVRAGLLAALATLPAVVVGLLLKDFIEESTASPIMAAAGFLVTAAVLLVTLRLPGGTKGAAETTPLDALLIGMAQAVAILPGVSRSGMTIATALGRGLDRTWAVGFSLFMAVPAILGACVLELKDVDRALLTPERITQTVVATIVSGLVGYLAIVGLVRIVRAGRLWYFSVYLIVLAAVVFLVLANRGEASHAAWSLPLDRAGFGLAGGLAGAGRAG
jgi:undecaprenyl-diphosphatase